MATTSEKKGSLKKIGTAVIAAASLGAATFATAQPAAAFGHGFHGGFGGFHRPFIGGGFRHGGFGGYRGGYHRGFGGFGYGLAGFGLGLGLGSLYGGYAYPDYGYYDAYYDYPYAGCLRRVYGYYGPHLVRVC